MKIITLLAGVLISSLAMAQVWVYEYPDVIVESRTLGKNLRSPLYKVEVIQSGKTYPSYVLADSNTFEGNQRELMTSWNHSTVFSFTGHAEIVVTRMDGFQASGSRILPMAKEVAFNVEGNSIRFTADHPFKYCVEMEGIEDQPLFIFGDGPEIEPPSPDDSNVLFIEPGLTGKEIRKLMERSRKPVFYFAPGIHSFGEETGADYPGYQLPILANKKYYLPGGAVVIGSFRGKDISNTTFTGRGMITACGKERLAQAKSIPYNLIMFDGNGDNQLVEGLTFTNPAHFILLSRGSWEVRNVKMFGWWHQTDGWGGGDHSLIEDSFLKVNDDYVKMYNRNHIARNLLVYKQINGAVIQLGWNSGAHGRECLAEDIYVVKDAAKVPRDISNTAVINLRNNSGNDISGFVIRNIFIESNVQRILGIEMKGGVMENFIIENVELEGQNLNFNYLFAHDGAEIRTFLLRNWIYNGEAVDDFGEAWLKTDGTVENIIIE